MASKTLTAEREQILAQLMGRAARGYKARPTQLLTRLSIIEAQLGMR
jgi:hypothetical protein